MTYGVYIYAVLLDLFRNIVLKPLYECTFLKLKFGRDSAKRTRNIIWRKKRCSDDEHVDGCWSKKECFPLLERKCCFRCNPKHCVR